jgi:hypothetical protein
MLRRVHCRWKGDWPCTHFGKLLKLKWTVNVHCDCKTWHWVSSSETTINISHYITLIVEFIRTFWLTLFQNAKTSHWHRFNIHFKFTIRCSETWSFTVTINSLHCILLCDFTLVSNRKSPCVICSSSCPMHVSCPTHWKNMQRYPSRLVFVPTLSWAIGYPDWRPPFIPLRTNYAWSSLLFVFP